MKAIEALTHDAGYYVLTYDGKLGCFQPDQGFIVDAELSETFARFNSSFLESYVQNPGADGWCLGIVYVSEHRKPWGTQTLLFDERVVRELYPVSGPASKELTAFQKKSRENSVYRAMELLLGYRLEIDREAPIFCPVLFDRGTTLGDYPRLFDPPLADTQRRLPAVEVLNLLAPIPVARRGVAAIRALMECVYQGVVKKEMRKQSPLAAFRFGHSPVDDLFAAAPATAASSKTARPVVAAAVKTRSAPSPLMSDREIASKTAELDALHRSQLVDSIERWRKPKTETLDPEVLRAFHQFSTISPTERALLAKWNPPYTAPAGACLIERNASDNWNLYLIEGQLSLKTADGTRSAIDGGSSKATYPISSLKPRKYTVTAATQVRFLWIHDDWIKFVGC